MLSLLWIMRYDRENMNVLLKNIVKLFGAVHNGTECFSRVSHEILDLLHSSRDTGQKFYTISCDCNVILNANLKHIKSELSE